MSDQVSGIPSTIVTSGNLQVQDCVMLWGHVLLVENSTRTRLYLSLQFNEYLEFDGNPVAQLDLFNSDQPLAGSLIWVKKTTPVVRIIEETAEQEGEFLRGAIARGFLSQLGRFTLPSINIPTRNPEDGESGGGCGSGAPWCPN